MRRIFSVLVVMAVMVAMLAVSAVQAFEQPDQTPNPSEQGREHISCAGQAFAGEDPGDKGPVVSERATEGGKDFGKGISSLREVPRGSGCDLGEDEDLWGACPTKDDSPNCISSAFANEASPFGNAEPGQVGSNNRRAAEGFGDRFGQLISVQAQRDDECELGSDPGPPGAFEPTPGAPG